MLTNATIKCVKIAMAHLCSARQTSHGKSMRRGGLPARLPKNLTFFKKKQISGY